MFKANEIIYQNNEWISFVFLTVLVLLTLAKYRYNDRLSLLNTFFLSKNYFLLYFNKEKVLRSDGFQFIMFVVQLLTIALLGFYLSLFYDIQTALIGFNKFLKIFLLAGVYLVGRFLVGLAFAWLFDLKEMHAKIVFEKSNYINNLILWILPLLLLTEYLVVFNLIILKITIIFKVILMVCRYILVLLKNKYKKSARC